MSGLLTATLMGSIAEDLDWLGTLLGGLTIMPYVSHSVYGGQPWLLCQACLGYTDQDCGDHRFDGRPPSPSTLTQAIYPKELSYIYVYYRSYLLARIALIARG